MGYDVDAVARQFAQLGVVAVGIPYGPPLPVIVGEDIIGNLVPRVGFVSSLSMRSLGIRRALPHCIERGMVASLVDTLSSEQGQITLFKHLRSSRLIDGQADDVVAQKFIPYVSGQWTSAFRAAGDPIPAGTYSNIPGGTALSRSSVGALSQLLREPPSGKKKYLLSMGMTTIASVGAWMLVDLLVAAGNINANDTAVQTVNTTALTRRMDGDGVMMTCEVTTTLGTTAANLTLTYTNQAGTGSRSTGAQALTTSAAAQRLVPIGMGPMIPLQSSDTGVRSVETAQLSAAMGAGVLAINLFVPICVFPALSPNIYGDRISPHKIEGLMALDDPLGCYTLYAISNSTSGPATTMVHLKTTAR